MSQMLLLLATCLALFAVSTVLPTPNAGAQAPAGLGPATTVIESCLAGDGRVDVVVVNTGTAEATYRVAYPNVTAREADVPASGAKVFTFTGRTDGNNHIRVTRDGTTSSTFAFVKCDLSPPRVDSREVHVINSCKNGSGRVDFMLVNKSASRSAWVLRFDGVPNRSTSAAGYALTKRAVASLENGSYGYEVVASGNPSDVRASGVVEVSCGSTPAPPTPVPPTPVPPTPVPTPRPSTPVPATPVPEAPSGVVSIDIGDPGCSANPSVDRANLRFTIDNDTTTTRRYDLRVGGHGHNGLRVRAGQTRNFTLQGIPYGTHDASVLQGDTTLSQKRGLVFGPCSGAPATPVPATPVPPTPVPATPVPATPGPVVQERLATPVINEMPEFRGDLNASWGPVPNATAYHIQVSYGGSTRHGDTPSTSWTQDNLNDFEGTICVRVIAVAGGSPRDSLPANKCTTRNHGADVLPIVVVPNDRVTEYNTNSPSGKVADLFGRQLDGVHATFQNLVGSTFDREATVVLFADRANEWFWCRPADVDPAALGCVADNYAHNMFAFIEERGYERGDEYQLVLALGGGGWAGASRTWSIVGEAGFIGARDGHCANVLDAFPGDGTSGRCTDGGWHLHTEGTIAHELGHGFGAPGHQHAPDCIDTSFMDAQWCYRVKPFLRTSEIDLFRVHFAR